MRYVLADAGVRRVLTRRELAADLADSGVTLLELDDGELQTASAAQPASRPGGSPGAEQLAYVLYTSGSTGRPKGVMVTHGNLASVYAGWERAYGLTREVRAHLQMASFGFDVFAGDVVRALASGGKLVLCRRSRLLDPPRLAGAAAAGAGGRGGVRAGGAAFAAAAPGGDGRSAGLPAAGGGGLGRLVRGGPRAAQRCWGRAAAGEFVRSDGDDDRQLVLRGEGGLDAVGAGADRSAVLPTCGCTCWMARARPVPIGVPGELYIGGRACRGAI